MKTLSKGNVSTESQSVAQLLALLVSEEKVVANLMQLETDKVLAFVGRNREFPSQPTSKEIIQFNQSLIQVLESIYMTEWQLCKKWTAILPLIPYESDTSSCASIIVADDNEDIARFYHDDRGFDY
ncbi:hypothetical protein [Paenibacillus arenosi]|uniref:Uncharacterized protein n=1 Tax=Paenibacillus arenosi TaxID=2774142 RepID=A0ABR9AZ27_9BACL|nr:hypothetical protein [Paenibacillus arenosi]MBD8498457.1 hypothetical protein [Paenibacillus arenosi]